MAAPKNPRPLPLPKETVTAIVDSLGKGMTHAQAAALHKVSEKSVQRIATNEQHRETIEQARLNLRAATATKLETLAPEVLVRIEQAVRDENLKPVDRAKVVDGLSRAAGALEKIAASTSGELIPKRDLPSVGLVIQIAPYAASADALAGKSLGAGIIIGQQVEHLSPHAEAAAIFTEPSDGQ